MKNFYFFDFLKNFFKWHNIPLMIYLLINLVFIYIGTVAVTYCAAMVYYDGDTAAMPVDVSSNRFYLITAFVIALVYFTVLSITLSPIGEWILRKRFRCKKIKDPIMRRRIRPLFNEVYAAARRKSPEISGSVKIFVQYSRNPNAFAVGRRSVCVTTGLLNRPDEEIKGILGHEFGHLAHKDTDLNLVVNIADSMTNLVFLGVWIVVFAVRILLKIISLVTSVFSYGASAFVTEMIDIMTDLAVFCTVYIFKKLWIITGNLLFMARNRKAEYDADRFSFELGYDGGIISFLYALPDSVKGKRNPVRRLIKAIATVGATHPQTWKRIEVLEKLRAKASEEMI